MAKSKQVTKKVEKKAEAPLTTKKQNETPYQLDTAQVERAANALVAHMKKHKEEKEATGTKDLMADEDEAESVAAVESPAFGERDAAHTSDPLVDPVERDRRPDAQ